MNPNIIVTKDINVPDDIPGIGHLYFERMKQHAKENKVFQIDADTGEKNTYATMLQRAIRTAKYLQEIGVKEGDIVAMYGPPHENSCIPFISSFFIGAIPTSPSPGLTEEETKQLVQLLDNPKVFFTIPDCVELIEKIIKDLGLDAKIIVFGDCENYPNYFKIIETEGNDDDFKPVEIDDLKKIAVLYYSSGSSGLPKAVSINHYAMIVQLQPKPLQNPNTEYMLACAKRIGNNFTVMAPGNFNWISAGVILSSTIYHGCTRILYKELILEKLWDIIEQFKVNFLLLSSNNTFSLCKLPPPKSNLIHLTTLLLAGSHVSGESIETLRKYLPNCLVYQGYSQTEFCGSNTHYDPYDKVHMKYILEKPLSVGLPGPGITYKIVDPDTNEILGPNQKGELRCKGQTMFNGYYRVDSKEHFDEDGFYKTGDLAYYDEDKCFYIVDRIKENFKYKGYHICPTELEDIIRQHPAVKEVAVIAIYHDLDQNHPVAIVVPNESVNVTAEEIREFYDSRVGDTKKLRGGVRLVNSLPMTVTGKVRKQELRRLVQENLI